MVIGRGEGSIGYSLAPASRLDFAVWQRADKGRQGRAEIVARAAAEGPSRFGLKIAPETTEGDGENWLRDALQDEPT